MTVATVVLRALDRVRERVLGLLCRSITQIPARQALRDVPDLPPGSLTGGVLTGRVLSRLSVYRFRDFATAMITVRWEAQKHAPVGEKAGKSSWASKYRARYNIFSRPPKPARELIGSCKKKRDGSDVELDHRPAPGSAAGQGGRQELVGLPSPLSSSQSRPNKVPCKRSVEECSPPRADTQLSRCDIDPNPAKPGGSDGVM